MYSGCEPAHFFYGRGGGGVKIKLCSPSLFSLSCPIKWAGSQATSWAEFFFDYEYMVKCHTATTTTTTTTTTTFILFLYETVYRIWFHPQKGRSNRGGGTTSSKRLMLVLAALTSSTSRSSLCNIVVFIRPVGWGEGGFGRPPPPLGAEVRLVKTDSQFVEQVVVTFEWC